METNGSRIEQESNMGEEAGYSDDKDKKRSRSQSPLDKNDSRDSTPNKSSRQSRNNRSRSPRGKRARAPTHKRVYIANIPYDCKWTTVKDLFKEKVGEVSYVELFQDETGKFRGCGIVELKDPTSVPKAVDVLHRYDFQGRQLVVKEDFDVDRDKTGKPLRGVRGGGKGGGGGDRNRENYGGRNLGGMGGMGGMGRRGGGGGSVNIQYDTYGLSPQFLDSIGITGPLTSKIFVANLDYKVTPSKLEEVFKLAGKVINIDLKKDEEGNSKGHGTIEMVHPVEAVQAISMFNGQKFFNRTMSVRMDKRHKDDIDDQRLPEGLQSVGKGLGANGLPLQLANASGGAPALNTGSMAPIGGLPNVGTSNLGMMQNSSMATAGMPSAGGVTGLGGIGMGLGLGADRGNYGSGVGLANVGQSLGLGNTAGGMTNAQMLGGGLNPMANAGAGLGALGGGLGNSLTGGLGLEAVGVGSVGGYNNYDRSYDQTGGSYNISRNSDTIAVRNLPASCTWQNLRDRFREIGDIRFTEMKGRGSAIIKFTVERDARRAVDLMRGHHIDGRPIDVTLY